jgi:hypothetical protein
MEITVANVLTNTNDERSNNQFQTQQMSEEQVKKSHKYAISNNCKFGFTHAYASKHCCRNSQLRDP